MSIMQIFVEVDHVGRMLPQTPDRLRRILNDARFAFYEAPDNDRLPKTLEEVEAILEHK